MTNFPRLNLVTKPRDTGKSCFNCRHWVEMPADPNADLRAPRQGICHFNPPTLFLVGMAPPPAKGMSPIPGFATARPQTRFDEFCGRFEA